jgi:hypothetical protein
MADGNKPEDKERVEEERIPTPEDNPRNKRMMEIAAREEEAKTDLVDVADEDHDKTTEVVEEEAVEKTVVAKRKIKVNGVEQELTDEEIVKLAEKSAGADEQFREAARLRKEAEELRRASPPKEEEKTEAVEEDDRALARALQMGNEEEAAAVIRKIRTRPSQDADVQRMIDQRLEFRNSAQWFQTEYPDIVQDPNLLQLVLAEDEKLVNAGDKRPYKARYEQIGNSLRKWRDGLKAPASSEERKERKANLQVVPSASVRAAPPKEEDDGPSDREFIAAEARRRGQGYPK